MPESPNQSSPVQRYYWKDGRAVTWPERCDYKDKRPAKMGPQRLMGYKDGARKLGKWGEVCLSYPESWKSQKASFPDM